MTTKKNSRATASNPQTPRKPKVAKGDDTITAGPSPIGSKPSEYDARFTRFLGELASLSEADWGTIVERFLKHKKSLALTRHRTDDILADISSGKIKPFGRTQAKWRVMIREANAVMFAATTHLPATRTVSGKALAFQDAAYLAVYHAVGALKVFAELDHSPGGREVLLRLLAPFDGLVTNILE